jgi:hypothetical protein
MMGAARPAPKEVVMPYHWWLIEGDNPGPKQRSAAVRKAVDDLPNVECRFVGWEPRRQAVVCPGLGRPQGFGG